MPLLLTSTDPRLGLRGRSLQHHAGKRGILPHASSAGRVAHEGGLRDHCIPLQHDGTQHGDAGLGSQVEGGWGEGLGCRIWVPGYESGKYKGEGEGVGGVGVRALVGSCLRVLWGKDCSRGRDFVVLRRARWIIVIPTTAPPISGLERLEDLPRDGRRLQPMRALWVWRSSSFSIVEPAPESPSPNACKRNWN